MMSSGPLLHSDMTVESPEFCRKQPSLQLSCRSSNSSLKSSNSTRAIKKTSIFSEEESSAPHGPGSVTVIHCSNGTSQDSSFTLETESRSMQEGSATIRSNNTPSWRLDSSSNGSRLDQVLDRVFVQVSPEGDIRINHLACLAHIQNVIRQNIPDAQILVFNCQELDPNVTEMFDEVIDCCFDLESIPDLDSLIRFCEICFGWLAQSSSNAVLFHAESNAATQRLLLLLFAYACFCDSVERQNIRINRRLKAYLSAYPNGNTAVPVVYLRFATYMKIFTPFRRQGIAKASMSIHSIVIHNCPLFTNHSVNIFFKFYSYSPLRHVYTTCVHTILGRSNRSAMLQFIEEPINLRGNVVILCYRIKDGIINRRRVFRLTFHSCEGYRDSITFPYDAFDDISEAVPATFQFDINLKQIHSSIARSSEVKVNRFLENTKDIRQRDTKSQSSIDSIDPLNIIQSKDLALDTVRLSDSLEDIDHLPDRSILIASTQEQEEVSRELVRNRTQTFNSFFMDTAGKDNANRWGFAMRGKRPAPSRPPPPRLSSKRAPMAPEEDWSQKSEMSDQISIDSGASLHSDSSGMSSRSLKNLAIPALKRIKKKVKAGFVTIKRSAKASKRSHSDADSQLMPPPESSVVPRVRQSHGGESSKSVSFSTASPQQHNCGPPPRPAPPKLTSSQQQQISMGKTPAGVRSVPTKYFGPREKYQRVSETDFAGVRSYRLQLQYPSSERSTPTILEEQEQEDFEEAEYRQLQKEGYNFHRHDHSGNMSTATTTQDLDQLLEELRRTSLDYSTSDTPLNNDTSHSSRVYSSSYQRSSFGDPSGRYSMRSSSFAGNRTSGRWGNTALAVNSSNSSSYTRSQAFSTERAMRGRTAWEMGGGDGFVRHSTPAPQLTSGQQNQRYQTTFRTTLQHRPPVSPKKYNQINVTIDPDFGIASSSLLSDNRVITSPSLRRDHSSKITNANSTIDGGTEDLTYRELQLMKEISSARQELEMLRRVSSGIDEPLNTLPPPATLPPQRRVFQQQHHENVEVLSNRHQSQYQSYHDIHQGSSLYRPHGRHDTMNSGFAYGAPKRAMSSANVTSSQLWNYRNGMMSGPQSPAPGYASMRSMRGSLRSGGGMLSGSEGYSARRERLRREAEQAEALRQSSQRLNHMAAASSNDLRSTAIHQQRRQHYHSMSTIHPERTEFEEIETVTLQPIGRGVQDLGSSMGSTATLNRAGQRPVASSMLEGLNRVEYGTGTRHPRPNMSSFGRQASAMDISQGPTIRPQRAASNSFLSSLRRQSASSMSEAGAGFYPQQQSQQMLTSKTSTYKTHQVRQQMTQQHHHQSSQQHFQSNGASDHITKTNTTNNNRQQSTRFGAEMQTQSQAQIHSQPMLFQSTTLQPHHLQQTKQQQHQQVRDEMDWSSQQNSSAGGVQTGDQMADLSLVEATSPAWYRLKISRQEAISILKNQPPGSFLVRDSTTFKDAYGLAVKSAKSPNRAGQKSSLAKFMKSILNDINNDLVRHYLIETVTTPTRGVRIKGFSAEQVYPNLLALIQHHTQYPVALPCRLVLPPIPLSQTGGMINTGQSTLVNSSNSNGNRNGDENGDSDSVTLVQNNGARSVNQTPTSLNGNNGGGSASANGGSLDAPTPARSITSPFSPTVGMFHSGLMSPPPNIACRCLYLGAVEVVDPSQSEQTCLMQAVDTLVPGASLQAATCDAMGVESPVQYTECQLQAAHNEGILLTDLSRKLFFQRHFSASAFVFAGVDPREKAFIHPNHSALGLDKPKLFGIIIKKLSGENVVHIFSEFDANCSATMTAAQINSLLNK